MVDFLVFGPCRVCTYGQLFWDKFKTAPLINNESSICIVIVFSAIFECMWKHNSVISYPNFPINVHNITKILTKPCWICTKTPTGSDSEKESLYLSRSHHTKNWAHSCHVHQMTLNMGTYRFHFFSSLFLYVHLFRCSLTCALNLSFKLIDTFTYGTQSTR